MRHWFMDFARIRSLLTRPLAFVTGAVILASVLAFGGRWSWGCELLVNFRTHYALLLGVALVVAVATRHWRTAAVAALGLAINLWFMRGAFLDAPAAAPTDGRAVRVVAFNVNVGNRDMAGIARYLGSLAPDVAVLEEMTGASADRLLPLVPGLAHHYRSIDEGIRGVVILSRWPLHAAGRVNLDGQMFGARADVDLGDRRLRLYGLHLNWPLVARAARARNAQLSALGAELAKCRGTCVAVGDFNTTSWSSHFRGLLEASGFRDCAAGRGLLPTWASGLPAPLRIRIDQCLAGGAVSVADVRVGESAGSDHFATINDLVVGTSGP
jgi:endonuclease/exonuclease/phosphatase (EEP) superfamily protein YafD